MIDADGVTVAVDGCVLLRPVDLHVARGEAVAVRGANGAGKTTLLRVVCGLRHPTAGRITVAGAPVAPRHATFRRRVAAAIDPVPFAPGLTLREQLCLVGTTWGRTVAEADDAADAVAAELGLSALMHRFPHELSSGQRQLASLAVPLVRPFDVLVLDEPEQRLDAAHVGAVAAALVGVRMRGATLIVATHDDELAHAVADRSVTLAAA